MSPVSSKFLRPHFQFIRVIAAVLVSFFCVAESTKAAVISTTFSSNNARRGNIFDIQVVNPLTVESISVNLEKDLTKEIFLYYKSGTWVGFQSNAAAWTLAGSVTVTSAGSNNPTTVDIPDFYLSGGTYGFYVTTDGTTSGAILYTGGSNSFSNSDITIFAGKGTVSPFDGDLTSGDRIWNGSITYSPTSAVPEPTSMAIFGFGALGLAYRARRNSKS